MQNLHLIILKGRLDYFEKNISKLKERVNRAIFTGENGEIKKHPLHFVSDCVYAGKISEQIGIGFIGVLLENGAYIDGFKLWHEDTPLIAAIGLYQEEIAHFLIDKHADLNHQGIHGATALHWAAWTGQDSIVNALLEFPIDIDIPDEDFGATPLLYGIHGYFRGGDKNDREQLTCIKYLLKAGANPKHKDREGNDAWDYLKDRDGRKILKLIGEKK